MVLLSKFILYTCTRNITSGNLLCFIAEILKLISYDTCRLPLTEDFVSGHESLCILLYCISYIQ